jgi:phenylalanine-4-hydroxylase
METQTTYCQVIDQPIEKVSVPVYTEEEHGTWALLLEAQEARIRGRAAAEFIEGLKAIEFPKTRIPKLRDVSARLNAATGWTLIRVEGLVHPRDFFKLLARKVFPSTDFIRKRSELMYTPAPDMFHDLFGHAPLLTNPDFTEFFECFGRVGVKASELYPETHEVHQMLPRLYWFCVEFGLIRSGPSELGKLGAEDRGVRAYGSGSVSSPQELEFCVSKECRHHSFDVDVIARRDYDIWHLQEDVFVIESFSQLGQEFRRWAKSYQLL